jgi:hypothetical protein
MDYTNQCASAGSTVPKSIPDFRGLILLRLRGISRLVLDGDRSYRRCSRVTRELALLCVDKFMAYNTLWHFHFPCNTIEQCCVLLLPYHHNQVLP